MLIPDVWYTYRFSAWIDAVLRPRLPSGLVGSAIVVVVTAVFSLLVAYFGERLLLGKRR